MCSVMQCRIFNRKIYVRGTEIVENVWTDLFDSRIAVEYVDGNFIFTTYKWPIKLLRVVQIVSQLQTTKYKRWIVVIEGRLSKASTTHDKFLTSGYSNTKTSAYNNIIWTLNFKLLP